MKSLHFFMISFCFSIQKKSIIEQTLISTMQFIDFFLQFSEAANFFKIRLRLVNTMDEGLDFLNEDV